MATGAAGLAIADKLPAITAPDAFEATLRFVGEVRGMSTAGHSFDAILKAYYQPYIAEQINKRNQLFASGEWRTEWVATDGRILTRRTNGD